MLKVIKEFTAFVGGVKEKQYKMGDTISADDAKALKAVENGLVKDTSNNFKK